MISRVIESKPDDMRAFVEEAAGISRYKERRKETESPHRRHARESRAPAGRARRSREADPPPAAPGGHRPPLPGLEGAGAQAHRGSARAAPARAGQRRRSARQRDARARSRHAGGAGGPALGRSGHREAARVPRRAERAASRRSRAATTKSARRFPAPSRASSTRASCASARRRISRSRAARSTTSPCTSSATSGSSPTCAPRSSRSRRSSKTAQHAETRRGRCLAGGRAGAAGVAAELGRLQSLARRRAPDHAGRTRAHRAAREPAAPLDGAGRSAGRRA